MEKLILTKEESELEKEKGQKSLKMIAVKSGLGKPAQRARGCVGGRDAHRVPKLSRVAERSKGAGPEWCQNCKPEPQRPALNKSRP